MIGVFLRGPAFSVLGCAFLCLIAGGCNRYSAKEHRVDAAQARQTLENVLNCWKEGATPESCKEMNPSVVVQDMDWKAGLKLSSFEILGDGEAVDANLRCPVKLTLQDPKQGQIERKVTYLVGTSPVLTVFRAGP